MTIPSWTEDLLRDTDDQSFCELVVTMVSTGDDPDTAIKTLYTPWLLQRLRVIKQRAAHVYFGSLLGPLRRLFPGQVFPPDLAEAMQGADDWHDGTSGDVATETWRAATERLYRQGVKAGAWPGWTNVAEYYTVRPGEMTIVTGSPSSMKSSWVQGLCVNLARASQWQFGMFSPEHAPMEELGAVLVQHKAGHLLQHLAEEEFLDTLDWVMQRFHYIEPPEEVAPSLAYLLAVARIQVERYQIRGLVLDPWNEIDHTYGRQSETQYISDALSRIRRFARHHQVHVWVVAHPTKMHKAESGTYAGKYPPARPYDISGAAHWYNKADNCISIWRDIDEDSPLIEVHIQKVRYRIAGKPGKVELTYHEGHFIEDAPEDGQWHY